MIDVEALKREGAKGRLKEEARQLLWDAKCAIEKASHDDFNSLKTASKIEDARIVLAEVSKL